MEHTLYTIGVASYGIHTFIDVLKRFGISTIADVRSKPYSSLANHKDFDREILIRHLESAGLSYVSMAEQLGGKPDDRSMYDKNGHIVFDRIRKRREFKKGIKWIIEALKTSSIALMCAEKDPMHCHRGIFLSEHIYRKKLLTKDICHIWPHRNADRKTEETESHEALRLRTCYTMAEKKENWYIAGLPKDKAIDEGMRLREIEMVKEFVYQPDEKKILKHGQHVEIQAELMAWLRKMASELIRESGGSPGDSQGQRSQREHAHRGEVLGRPGSWHKPHRKVE